MADRLPPEIQEILRAEARRGGLEFHLTKKVLERLYPAIRKQVIADVEEALTKLPAVVAARVAMEEQGASVSTEDALEGLHAALATLQGGTDVD